jgi:hypothetical protein
MAMAANVMNIEKLTPHGVTLSKTSPTIPSSRADTTSAIPARRDPVATAASDLDNIKYFVL